MIIIRNQTKQLFISILFIGLINFTNTNAQTVLISPTGDGGFENGTTFVSNGWTESTQPTTSFWEVGTVAVPYAGSRGVYVANPSGTYSYNSGASKTTHFYRDVIIPTGATAITLSFYWKGKGESSYDRALVYTAPTSVTPVKNVPASSSTTLTGATLVWTQPTFTNSSTYTLATITLPNTLAGTTVRIIFTWQNDGSGGTTPGAAIDNISLTYNDPLPCSGIPTGLTTTNIGTTTATISWTALSPAPANGYEYYYNTTGIAPNSSTTASGSVGAGVTSANLTGLSPNTIYYFWVRANCGSPDGVGNWSNSGNFYTGYCTSIGSSSSYYINNFTTSGGTTNISNTSSGYSTNGYNNAIGQVVTQEQNGVINFTVSFGSSTSSTFGFGIWVDWNNDLDFSDAGENVFISTSYNSSYTGSFTVPAGAPAGSHRMRIVTNYYSTSPLACNTTAITGETEDYTLNVVILQPCTGTPTGGTSTATVTTGCSGYTSLLGVTGGTSASGVTYQWESSSTGSAPWSPITGATSATYTATVTSGIYYHRVITCTSTSQSATSINVHLVVTSCGPPPCGVNPSASDVCGSATSICNLNGYCGNTSSTYTVDSPGNLSSLFCGSLDNNSWLKFVADETTATLNIYVSNCTYGDGIQMEVYGTSDCNTFVSHSNCWNPGVMQNGTITATGLTIGQTYYLMIDGWAGDHCDYTISAASGVLTPEINTPGSVTSICNGGSIQLIASGGTTYQWSPTTGLSNPNIANPIASPTTTTIYTVSVSGGNASCPLTNSTSITITVNPGTPATASNNGPLCLGQTLNLTCTPNSASSYSWSGPNSFTSTSQNPTIANATSLISGTYTVTVTSSGGCISTATTSVVVNSSSSATISSNTPCEGSSLNLTTLPAGGTNYNWSGPNSFTSTIQSPVITGVTSAAAGTYNVTVTSTGGCTSTGTYTVTINPLPVLTVSNNGPICAGITLNLTSLPDGATSYNWSGPSSFTSTTQNPSLANSTTGMSGNYIVTVTLSTGCSATASTNVTVNMSATASSTSNTPCEGSNLNLTSSPSGAASYSWSGPNTYTSTVQNPIIASATTANSGTYYVTVTMPGGCTSTSSVVATVNPVLTASASNDGPKCVGTNLSLTSLPSGGASYNWSGPNAFTSTSQNPSLTSVTTGMSGTYTVTITATGGCTSTAQTTAIINANPVVTPSSNTPICQGQTLNLTLPVSGTSYAWSGPSSFTSTNQSPSITNTTSANSGIYTVTVTNSSNCTSTNSVSVTVNALPIPIITGDSVFCGNETSSLTASGGNTYLWSNSLTTPTISIAPTTSTTYTVTVTSLALCTANLSRLVTVNQVPQISSITKVDENCNTSNGSATVNLTLGDPPISYTWSNGGANNATINNLAAGDYTVTVTSGSGCTATESFSIANILGPQLVLSSFVDDHCSQGIGQATVTVSNGIGNFTYTWFTTPPQIGNTASGLSAGVYSVEASNGTCSDTISVTIGNVPNPIADFIPTPIISSLENAFIRFNNQSIGGLTYFWSFGDGGTSNEENPLHQYLNSENYLVYLVVQDDHGCADTSFKTVIIYDDLEIFIPNAFTPNGDGINDIFKPYGKGYSIDGYEMQIYDRWGKMIFVTTDFEKGWNGKIDGVIANVNAVFIYKIVIKDLNFLDHYYKGTFTILGSKPTF